MKKSFNHHYSSLIGALVADIGRRSIYRSFFAFALFLDRFDCFTRGWSPSTIIVRISILLLFATGVFTAVLVALRVRRLRKHDFELFKHLLDFDLIWVAEVKDGLTEFMPNLL
jgi:hypothetical protein